MSKLEFKQIFYEEALEQMKRGRICERARFVIYDGCLMPHILGIKWDCINEKLVFVDGSDFNCLPIDKNNKWVVII